MAPSSASQASARIVSLSRPPLPASESLSTSDGAEIERARHVGAGAAAHQAVVEAGELALAGRRIDLAQELGDGEAQHAVAQELQPLVVAALGRGLAHAGVRQRLLEQRRDP